MGFKYVLVAGSVLLTFASSAMAQPGRSNGPGELHCCEARIWALTAPMDHNGVNDVDLYCIDMNGSYQRIGRMPRIVGKDNLQQGHWSGLAVKNHTLYFCTKDRRGTAKSEIIAELNGGSTDSIPKIGDEIKLKKTGGVGLLADIGGMCLGADGMLYLANVSAKLETASLQNPITTRVVCCVSTPAVRDPRSRSDISTGRFRMGTWSVASRSENIFFTVILIANRRQAIF